MHVATLRGLGTINNGRARRGAYKAARQHDGVVASAGVTHPHPVRCRPRLIFKDSRGSKLVKKVDSFPQFAHTS
jgi:hypothetical protein